MQALSPTEITERINYAIAGLDAVLDAQYGDRACTWAALVRPELPVVPVSLTDALADAFAQAQSMPLAA